VNIVVCCGQLCRRQAGGLALPSYLLSALSGSCRVLEPDSCGIFYGEAGEAAL
jgi:hypothetical protein